MGLQIRRPQLQLQRSRSRMKGDKVDIEKGNADLQVKFEKEMDEKVQGHLKVAVLMLSWLKENPGDMDTADEVARLTDVFEGKYNFTVHHGLINQQKSAKNQINHYLAKFVLDEDDEKTLLIIYYAGHGVENSTTDEFVLAGGNPVAPEKRKTKYAKEIVWRKAETLIEETEADMLLIFDCCHAGRVAGAKSRGFSTRIFEVLGACQANETTVAPGDESFTNALIWALAELSSTPEGFTTAQLYAKILEAGTLPDEQHPYWSEKLGVHSLRRLKITAVSKSEVGHADRAVDQSVMPIEYFLNLSLMFAEMPTNQDISDMCTSLKDIVKPLQDRSKTQAHQVLWRGLFGKDKLKEEFSSVAEKAFWKWRSQTLESRLRDVMRAPGYTRPPQHSAKRPTVAARTSAISKDGLIGTGATQTIFEVSHLPQGDIRLHPTKRQPVLRGFRVHDIYKRILIAGFVLGIGVILGEYRERLWYDSQVMTQFNAIWLIEWVKMINGTA